MSRSELDRLLENAVAEALGVKPPTRHRRPTLRLRREARTVKRHRQAVRELHPA